MHRCAQNNRVLRMDPQRVCKSLLSLCVRCNGVLRSLRYTSRLHSKALRLLVKMHKLVGIDFPSITPSHTERVASTLLTSSQLYIVMSNLIEVVSTIYARALHCKLRSDEDWTLHGMTLAHACVLVHVLFNDWRYLTTCDRTNMDSKDYEHSVHDVERSSWSRLLAVNASMQLARARYINREFLNNPDYDVDSVPEADQLCFPERWQEPPTNLQLQMIFERMRISNTSEALSALSMRYADVLCRQVRAQVAEAMSVRDELARRIDVDTAMESIVLKSDAEMGSMIFRDMILSFALPRDMIGLRSTLLMTRDMCNVATAKFPKIVEHAYNASLMGASRVWEHGVLDISIMQGEERSTLSKGVKSNILSEAQDNMKQFEERKRREMDNKTTLQQSEMERACVILTGLAMAYAPSANDARKGLAFNGCVRLPFLSLPTRRPTAGASVLELACDGTWVLYSHSSEFGIHIVHKQAGLAGLQIGAAILLHETVPR